MKSVDENRKVTFWSWLTSSKAQREAWRNKMNKWFDENKSGDEPKKGG